MRRLLPLLRDPRAPILVLLALLTLRYFATYLAESALPGTDPAHPLGWWGWWDQSQYIRSARALAAGDLSVPPHWYPMGYALLGAPFVRLWPDHPYILVNLVSLWVTAFAFLRLARLVRVREWVAALLFLGSVAVDPMFFRQWSVPWNTSPTTAVLWVLLWQAGEHMARQGAGRGRAVALGALVAAVGVLRPTDLLPAAIILGGVGLHELWRHRLGAWGTVWRAALGGAAVAGAALALHVSIYGLAPSPYMAASQTIGFSFHAFGWKAFNLLVAPVPWWGTGQGLLARHPWIGLAFVLLPFAVARAPVVAVMAAAALTHMALYIAYVDLLPTGLWLFLNVHYFKWMIPAFALLGWLGVAEAAAWGRGWRLAAWGRGWRLAAPAAAAAGVFLLLCLRVMPMTAPAEATRWRGLTIPGPVPGFDASYFKMDAAFRDAAGEMRNVTDMRLYPVPQGTRLLALRRDIVPPVEGLAPGARPVVSRVMLGWPCWLPGRPRACRRLGA